MKNIFFPVENLSCYQCPSLSNCEPALAPIEIQQQKIRRNKGAINALFFPEGVMKGYTDGGPNGVQRMPNPAIRA